MAHRSTISQNVQLGVESTPGTAVPANKKLQALGFTIDPHAEFTNFRPTGSKWATIQALDAEWATGRVEGYPTYNEIIYVLASVLGAPTTTAVNTTGHQHVFTPHSLTEDTPVTFTLERGSAVQAERTTNGIITDLAIPIQRRGNPALSGTLLAQSLATGITMTATPTSIVPALVLLKHWDIFVDPTSAALGTTKLLHVVSMPWSIGGRFGPLFFIDSSQASFSDTVETTPDAKFELALEADAVGMSYLATARLGSKFYVRAKATGPNIPGVTPSTAYSLQIDMCVEISAIGAIGDEGGVYGSHYTLTAADDPTWGQAMQITVVNELATL